MADATILRQARWRERLKASQSKSVRVTLDAAQLEKIARLRRAGYGATTGGVLARALDEVKESPQ